MTMPGPCCAVTVYYKNTNSHTYRRSIKHKLYMHTYIRTYIGTYVHSMYVVIRTYIYQAWGNRHGASAYALVLISILSTYFQVLEGAFKHLLSRSICACGCA